MLTASFELFKEEYFPSFMLAQKYVLPLILSSMAVMFFTFFEPERLSQKGTLIFLRLLLTGTLVIFTLYLTTLNAKDFSPSTLALFALQWCATLFEAGYFFLPKNDKAAS